MSNIYYKKWKKNIDAFLSYFLLQAAWILDEASDDDEDSVKSDEKMDTNQETDEDDGVLSEERNDEQDDIVSYGDGDDDCQSEMMVLHVNITDRLFEHLRTIYIATLIHKDSFSLGRWRAYRGR